ncbi:MAG: restriction endonuclease subunit S [Planctomycetota bacterium]
MIRHKHQTILGDIPSDWDARPLRSLLADELSGDWGDDEGEVTLSVLRSTNFTDSGNLKLDDVAKRGFTRTKAEQVQVQPNDILVERSGGGPNQPVGRVAMIREEMPDTGFANFVQTLRPDSTKISPELLLWTLHQLNRSGYVEKLQHQTTQMRNLDLRDYLKVLVPVPRDSKEQTRIAEALSAADDHIRALEEQLRKAERVKKGLVEQGTTIGLNASAATKITNRYRCNFMVNANWEQIELRTLKPQIDYGTNQSSNDHRSGVPVIAIPQVIASRFVLGELPFADVPDQERDTLALKPHDVLVVRTNGNPSYIGRSTVIPEGVLDGLTIFASYLIRIRLDESRLRGAFLNYVLLSQTGRRQSTCLANTSAGNFNLGARSLSKFLIPLPRPEEQDEIIEALNAADDLVLDLQNQLTAARRVKQSLLQNLLTGKIRLKP